MSDHQSAPTTIDSEVREDIFWQLNNLLCNTTPNMCEEAREIEASGSIKDGGRGGVDYTLQITHQIDQITNLIAQEANKARIEEMRLLNDVASLNIHGDYVDSAFKGYADERTARIKALTADKESK